MAQRYVLEGGTPFTVPVGDQLISAKRKGFPGTYRKGRQRSAGFAYGDPVIRSDAKDGFGIVPMPGITSANVRTKSAYGSLRTGKIEFKCYNQRQLEILEMLYMRPGYSVLLEWGWTPYVNNFGQTTNTFPYCGGFYDDDATHEIIEKQIYDNKRISGGNYDALMGIVRNFEYKLRDDGGYDCQT